VVNRGRSIQRAPRALLTALVLYAGPVPGARGEEPVEPPSREVEEPGPEARAPGKAPREPRRRPGFSAPFRGASDTPLGVDAGSSPRPQGPGHVPEKGDRKSEATPGEGPERPGPGDVQLEEEALRIEARIREIQLDLLEEIAGIERRLGVIRRRLERELGIEPLPVEKASGTPGLQRPPGDRMLLRSRKKALEFEPAWQDPGEERRYRLLLNREEEIVAQWRGAGARARRGSPEERQTAESEKAALRVELGRVLEEILDVREKARERQLERLRREIEDIERALRARRDEGERKRLVDSRMKELLGSSGR
jgi:hypothetical protein